MKHRTVGSFKKIREIAMGAKASTLEGFIAILIFNLTQKNLSNWNTKIRASVSNMDTSFNVDGHHMIEKRSAFVIETSEGVPRRIYYVKTRTIDDQTIAETKMTWYEGALKRKRKWQETSLNKEQIRKFEEEWTNLWPLKQEQ